MLPQEQQEQQEQQVLQVLEAPQQEPQLRERERGRALAALRHAEQHRGQLQSRC